MSKIMNDMLLMEIKHEYGPLNAIFRRVTSVIARDAVTHDELVEMASSLANLRDLLGQLSELNIRGTSTECSIMLETLTGQCSSLEGMVKELRNDLASKGKDLHCGINREHH